MAAGFSLSVLLLFDANSDQLSTKNIKYLPKSQLTFERNLKDFGA